MKKPILLLLMFVVFCGSAGAQKGRSGVGLGLTYGYETYNYEADHNMGVTLKYQYGISNMFEIEPSFTYYVYGEGPNYYDSGLYKWRRYITKDYRLNYALGVNLHTYFLKTRHRPYLITGFQAYGIRWPKYDVTPDPYYAQGKLVTPSSETLGGEKCIKPAAHVGVGADFRLSYHFNLQLELGYDTYLKVFANLTYVYKF